MMRLLCLLLLLVLIFTLCACGYTITEGEVYEKEHRAAFTSTTVLPMAISNGKTTTTVFIPYIIHYPERWVIHIKCFNGEKWLTEDFYVSKEVYDSIEIGSMFKFDEERGDLKEEPYTKEKQETKEN